VICTLNVSSSFFRRSSTIAFVASVAEPELADAVEPELAGAIEPELAGAIEPELAGVVEPELTGIGVLPFPQLRDSVTEVITTDVNSPKTSNLRAESQTCLNMLPGLLLLAAKGKRMPRG
jgi:hypothetical protein